MDISTCPEEPLPSDCCNSGCTPCILDVYKDLFIKWEEKCKISKTQKTSETSNQMKLNHAVLCPTKYTCFMVKHVKNICQDTIMVCLQAVLEQEDTVDGIKYCDVSQPLDFLPGQHFVMQGCSKNEGKKYLFSRPYTPISDVSLSRVGCFEVVVKLYPGGQMSQYWQTLNPGDVTRWRGPYGNFTYSRNAFSHVLMLCAGTGIAPMYCIANNIVHDEQDDTIIKILFCCRDFNSIILRSALNSMRSYWNFHVDIYLSHENEVNCRPFYGETLKTARITENVIASELQKLKADNTLVLICGNTVFCDQMNQFISQSCFQVKQVYIFS